jgi:hypothetical protein
VTSTTIFVDADVLICAPVRAAYHRSSRDLAAFVGNDKPTDRRERRVNPRAEISATAVVLARHNSGVAFTIETISIGGAGLVGPLTLSQGERIQILFELDGHPIDVHGEVLKIVSRTFETDRIMVRFVDLAPATRELIRALVLRRLEREDEAR